MSVSVSPDGMRTLLVLMLALFSVISVMDARGAGSTELLEEPKQISAINLKDHDGKPFTRENLKGQWSLMFLGFTACPDVCPLTLTYLEAIRAELGLRMRPESLPQIIFLAVDPDRDRALLKDYLAHFHPDHIGITGEPEEIDNLIESLDAFYRLERKTPDQKNYNVLHTAWVAVINPDAEMVARISPPFHPHKTSDYLARLIRGVY